MNALGQLIGVLFVVGLIIRYFWWLTAVVAVVAVVKRAPSWWARHQAAVEARAAEQRDRGPG
jgi:ABC-type bacteriocin/lantibiotic exporter with double-glycine peptidase domain